MRFEAISQLLELPVKFRHFRRHLLNGFWSSDAGNDIFSLRVNKILSVQFILTGAWIASKTNPGCRVIAKVSIHHGHNIDCSAMSHLRGDRKFPAIIDCSFAHP